MTASIHAARPCVIRGPVAMQGARTAIVVLPVTAVEEEAAFLVGPRGVETINLHQVHFPSPLASPGATMAPLHRLVEQRLVRQIG